MSPFFSIFEIRKGVTRVLPIIGEHVDMHAFIPPVVLFDRWHSRSQPIDVPDHVVSKRSERPLFPSVSLLWTDDSWFSAPPIRRRPMHDGVHAGAVREVRQRRIVLLRSWPFITRQCLARKCRGANAYRNLAYADLSWEKNIVFSLKSTAESVHLR